MARSNTSPLRIAFFNPSAERNYYAWNLTWMFCKTHYDLHGRHRDAVQWIEPIYDWYDIETIEQAIERYIDADVIMFSSYIWNYSVNDQAACWIKQHHPHIKTLLGGPQVDIHRRDFEHRYSMYDYICEATMPAELYMQDWIDSWFKNNHKPDPAEIAFDIKSRGLKKSFYYPYVSVYREHYDYIRRAKAYFESRGMPVSMIYESTRGCPFRCTFCEWGGGTGVKLEKKTIEQIREDLDCIEELGFKTIDLIDSNIGMLEKRDFEMLRIIEQKGMRVHVLSLLKTEKLERKKKIIDQLVDLGLRANLSVQTFSQEALNNALRPDLTLEQQFELCYHIRDRLKQRYGEEFFRRPYAEIKEIASVEFIMGMPGSTIDDFYSEFEMMEILHSWSDPRFEYSYLPATEASSAGDLEKHSVELTAIYSTSMFGTKNYFHTIAGCYSFAREDLYEMFFMNLAAQSLRMNYYDQYRDFISISDFMRSMYPILQNCAGFEHIHQQIVDLYDPTTEARDLFYLIDSQGQQRYKRDVIADFIASNDAMIRLLLVNELVA